MFDPMMALAFILLMVLVYLVGLAIGVTVGTVLDNIWKWVPMCLVGLHKWGIMRHYRGPGSIVFAVRCEWCGRRHRG